MTDALEVAWSTPHVPYMLCKFHDEMIFAAPRAFPVSLPPPISQSLIPTLLLPAPERVCLGLPRSCW